MRHRVQFPVENTYAYAQTHTPWCAPPATAHKSATRRHAPLPAPAIMQPKPIARRQHDTCATAHLTLDRRRLDRTAAARDRPGRPLRRRERGTRRRRCHAARTRDVAHHDPTAGFSQNKARRQHLRVEFIPVPHEGTTRRQRSEPEQRSPQSARRRRWQTATGGFGAPEEQHRLSTRSTWLLSPWHLHKHLVIYACRLRLPAGTRHGS